MFQAFLDLEEDKSDQDLKDDTVGTDSLQNIFSSGAKPSQSNATNQFNFQLPQSDTPSLFGSNSQSETPLFADKKSDALSNHLQKLNSLIPAFGTNSLFEDDQNEGDDTDVLNLLNLFNQDCNL